MKYSDSDVSVAKAAFAFLLDSYLATHCQDPAGDYLRVLVANRMEGRPVVPVSATEEPREAALLAPPPAAPALPPSRARKSPGAWTPEQRAKAAATRAANKAKKAVGMS